MTMPYTPANIAEKFHSYVQAKWRATSKPPYVAPPYHTHRDYTVRCDGFVFLVRLPAEVSAHVFKGALRWVFSDAAHPYPKVQGKNGEYVIS